MRLIRCRETQGPEQRMRWRRPYDVHESLAETARGARDITGTAAFPPPLGILLTPRRYAGNSISYFVTILSRQPSSSPRSFNGCIEALSSL
jgi:hypothetical protein